MNHAIAQRINPGSTFKLANLIVLLEDAGMSLDEVIDIDRGKKQVGPRWVEDSHEGPETMTLREVFYQSSNVGFAQAVYDHYRDSTRRVKTRQQHYVDQLGRLGVRDTLPFQIAGLRGPMVHDTKAATWSDWSLPSMAYGYELEMTPLQTLVLYNTVANDGKMMAPLLVRELRQYGETVKTWAPQVLREQIASPQTIALAQESLRGVATDGTAQTLKIKGLAIAVKTGTAQIPNRNRGYGRGGTMDYLATLAGYFPADDPKYSLIVAIQTYTGAGGGALYYGGSLAGPVFRAIAERVYGTSIDWQLPLSQRDSLDTEPPRVKGGDPRAIEAVLKRLEVDLPLVDAPLLVPDSTGRLIALRTESGLVPDVTGLSLQDAVRQLESLGLRTTFSGKGAVVRQSVAPGAELQPGMEVGLELSEL
jgi:cell division protein FtsI (penicillin-binding protein 3)